MDARPRVTANSANASEQGGDLSTDESWLREAVQGSHVESWLPPPGSVIDGKYQVGRLLGQGGMGAVFEATHLMTSKRVALKWMCVGHSERAGARLLREAKAAGSVHHQNVVAIYDAGVHQGAPYLVMELLQGESLEARLARSALTVLEAVDVTVQVCRGVAAVHARGIVHRDLKPANIFLCAGLDVSVPVVKVLDFGVSKFLEGPEAQARLTSTGAQVGTPLYMSPEQLAGKAADARADVYSLAVTLYVMLTRRHPHAATNVHELVAKVFTSAPTRLAELRPELPPDLEHTVMRSLALHPEDRIASVAEFAAALEPFASLRFDGKVRAGGTAPRAPDDLAHRQVAARGHRIGRLSVFGVGLFSLLALGSFGLLRASHQTVPQGPAALPLLDAPPPSLNLAPTSPTEAESEQTQSERPRVPATPVEADTSTSGDAPSRSKNRKVDRVTRPHADHAKADAAVPDLAPPPRASASSGIVSTPPEPKTQGTDRIQGRAGTLQKGQF